MIMYAVLVNEINANLQAFGKTAHEGSNPRRIWPPNLPAAEQCSGKFSISIRSYVSNGRLLKST